MGRGGNKNGNLLGSTNTGASPDLDMRQQGTQHWDCAHTAIVQKCPKASSYDEVGLFSRPLHL